jgi:hypothetical protein
MQQHYRHGCGVVGKCFRWIAALFLLFMSIIVLFPPPDLPAYSTIITDNKGQVIHAYLTPDEKWRMKNRVARNFALAATNHCTQRRSLVLLSPGH